MLKRLIASLIERAAVEAQRQGVLPAQSLPPITVEYPPDARFGDYATSLPLKLARSCHTQPLVLARELSRLLPPSPEIDRVEVAPPGYINFFLSPSWLCRQVDAILEAGERFGDVDVGGGRRVQLEFVSVNPTGPLHVGHGRGAVLGSTLARVLAATGYRVEREYYINDAGTQIEVFARSLYVRYLQALGREAEMPGEGYFGEYMKDLAREVVAEHGDRFARMPAEEAVRELGRLGMEKVLGWIREDLKLLGVEFDSWFSESSLIENGVLAHVLSLLRRKGYIEDREGAQWFVSTALGESKDNVLVRSMGSPTYFATDIAYHYNKFMERNYDMVINIWGADHQGHVSRMKAAVNALGIEPERLRILITQMVALKRGGEEVRASKRTGDVITLREVIEEVGADACRFFFLARTPDSQMEFDLELAKKESPDNPVYYVQYAHARISGILRRAEEQGLKGWERGDVSLLLEEPEQLLIRRMLRLPEVVETVALTLEPHYLSHYALDVATAFHNFYEKCRVISSDHARSAARLKLVKAAGIVLAKVLGLMGMTAPERM